MEVQIAFTFDASELGGKELVTFEELYDLSNPDEPTKVTEHKDIEGRRADGDNHRQYQKHRKNQQNRNSRPHQIHRTRQQTLQRQAIIQTLPYS